MSGYRDHYDAMADEAEARAKERRAKILSEVRKRVFDEDGIEQLFVDIIYESRWKR